MKKASMRCGAGKDFEVEKVEEARKLRKLRKLRKRRW